MKGNGNNRFDNRILVLLSVVLVWFLVRILSGAKFPDLTEEMQKLQPGFQEFVTEATDGDEEWHLFERAFGR